MTDRVPPHSLPAEAALIGALLLSGQAINDVVDDVITSDFYSPAHAAIFDAITRLHAGGVTVDVVTVAEELHRAGLLDQAGGTTRLDELARDTPSTTNTSHYARILARHAASRRLIAIAGELTTAAYDGTDPAELLDQARATLEEVDLPTSRLPDGLWDMADFLDRPDTARADWVVPGLIRQDWRVVVVAPEGIGKTVLLRQVAVCAGFGIEPLTLRRGPRPVRTLVVDLENPEESVTEVVRPIWSEALRIVGLTDPADMADRVALWHRPGGIDLRRRADSAAFEAVLERVRPELVCFGPLYKAAAKNPGEGWDELALGTQHILDRLRTRYRFGILMEDHAPQADGGHRSLRPFGSSLWLRWPELGIAMAPDDDKEHRHKPRKVKLGRFRGDRLACAWPESLDRRRGKPGWISTAPDPLDGIG